jgi:hypothetical protein
MFLATFQLQPIDICIFQSIFNILLSFQEGLFCILKCRVTFQAFANQVT